MGPERAITTPPIGLLDTWGRGADYGGRVGDPEQVPWTRKVPPITYLGVLFVAMAFLADDVRALYIAGFLLVVASLQWGRTSNR
jgi:hypothetical protein